MTEKQKAALTGLSFAKKRSKATGQASAGSGVKRPAHCGPAVCFAIFYKKHPQISPVFAVIFVLSAEKIDTAFDKRPSGIRTIVFF
ncbi:MAG: hypothetical protein LBH86_09470 [Oscillospiraceae bacterium]|jgi:hypothetical protein|nr:hypothetical protein [Oscillospiraceae bacterium]